MKAKIEFNGKVGEITLTKEQQKVFAEVIKPKSKYEFKEGQKVYFIRLDGSIANTRYEKVVEDILTAKRNKYSHTEAEAQFQADKELLIAEIDRFIEENGGELTEEEWRNGDVMKYCLSFDYNERPVAISVSCDVKYKRACEKYFRSSDIAYKGINLFGERMKKYLL